MKHFLILPILIIIVSLLSVACSFGDKDGNNVVPVHNQWVWLSGEATLGQWGIYGTKSTPASTNVPGARESAVSWIDTSGNLWLFGGAVYDVAMGTYNYFNDLWKFDGINWTWMSGENTVDQAGTYDTYGSPGVPGARIGAVSWIDQSGNLWLFGGYGYGYDSSGTVTLGELNDLWKFDGSNWTWVSGANAIGQAGTYGTKGTPADTNVPGARFGAVSWIDTSGSLWLFGGYGYDSAGTGELLNDLWKFDGNNWTWVSGANTFGQAGTYGTKGTPADTNVPGARFGAVSWTDTSGSLWLFGGYGYDSAGAVGDLNDLWKFDGNNWIWVSGANTFGQAGTYGQKNTTDASYVPGARFGAVSWIDTSGSLWLFGGYGYDSAGAVGDLNDLWKFDDSNWTWVSGADTTNQPGTYGQKNTTDASYVPGARDSAVSWIDKSGFLWLFGGYGYDANGQQGNLNDLWGYQP